MQELTFAKSVACGNLEDKNFSQCTFGLDQYDIQANV